MSAIVRYLGSLSSYPIPQATLQNIALSVGLDIDKPLWQDVLNSRELKKAMAKVYFWLAVAPDVSQGGISFSFTEYERTRLRQEAQAILDELGEGDDGNGVSYGYMGEDL